MGWAFQEEIRGSFLLCLLMLKIMSEIPKLGFSQVTHVSG